VVSVTHPSGRILGFLDRSRYFFFQVVPTVSVIGIQFPIRERNFLFVIWTLTASVGHEISLTSATGIPRPGTRKYSNWTVGQSRPYSLAYTKYFAVHFNFEIETMIMCRFLLVARVIWQVHSELAMSCLCPQADTINTQAKRFHRLRCVIRRRASGSRFVRQCVITRPHNIRWSLRW
jgi:hypothetical protein